MARKRNNKTSMNINESQTKEFRRFKYDKLIEAGAPTEIARKKRDYPTMACIAAIARLRKLDKQTTGQYFFQDLAKKGIKPYRETPIMHHIQNQQCNQETK